MIYLVCAYGLTAFMSIFMFIGFRKGIDLSTFPTAQMMYPAIGVILGKIMTRSEGEKLPLFGYIVVLITTIILMIMAVASIFVNLGTVETTAGEIDVMYLYSQYPLIAGSVIVYIAFWVCGRQKRENAGLSRRRIDLSIAMVALFFLLYFSRILINSVIASVLNGEGAAAGLSWLPELLQDSSVAFSFLMLPINFFLSWIAFFGEEYGWRYYLQPALQERFGKRRGILVLGLLWALWHINIDFMYYSVEHGLEMFLAQIVTCIALGIFFGYAYMKTNNIWVPVILHYMNNNLISVLSGGDANVLQNQQVSFLDIPIHLIGCLVFIIFILAPVFRKDRSETLHQNI